jgi:hypothetical protein
MNHGLLVPAQVVSKFRVLLERLTNARNVAVAEDPETPFEKAALLSVAARILILEESDDSLRNRKSSLHGVALLGRMHCRPIFGSLRLRT